ncbi:MAG: outer membrane beta-barrel protein [Flavobacteriaceae bacterium]|nr:PorT family protein [Flavobacteriaceae bacterium]
MKKIFFIVIFSIISTLAISQVTFKPGVKTGLNLSKISNFEDKGLSGFYGGLLAELKFDSSFALQPEIIYSQQGSKNVRLDYLSFAIASKLFFTKQPSTAYIVFAPSFDINLNGSTESYTYNEDYYYSTGVTFQGDITFSGGIGYSFPIDLDIEFRYKKGIIDAIDDGETRKRLNSVFQIGMVYKFNFKK